MNTTKRRYIFLECKQQTFIDRILKYRVQAAFVSVFHGRHPEAINPNAVNKCCSRARLCLQNVRDVYHVLL